MTTPHPAAAAKEGEDGAALGPAGVAGLPAGVHVSVDLRVLLKLAKAAPPPLPEVATPRRKGGARNRHAHQQPQRKEPMVCAFLKCSYVDIS